MQDKLCAMIMEFIFMNKQTCLVAKISVVIFIPNNVESELVSIVSNKKINLFFSIHIVMCKQ